MSGNFLEEFDGYQEIAQATQMSRKYGADYSLDRHGADQFINRLHPARIDLRVADVIPETPSTKTLRLVSAAGPLPPFQAGQYLALFVEVDHVRTSRPYSISSPPNQIGYYEITVRRVEGGLVSNYLLDDVGPGDRLTASGPAGHFYHNPLCHQKEMVCLAGGSGITPFYSMIREVWDCGLDRTIRLIYGNRTVDEIVFHDQLTSLAERFRNFTYRPVVEKPAAGWDGPTGYITRDLIQETVGDVSSKTFYLCGPQAMYDFCLAELAALGVERRRIRREVYGPPPAITQAPGWPPEVSAEDLFTVTIQGGPTFTARAAEPLLTGLERAGLATPSLCRSGECSQCRVRVVSGRVFEPAGALVRRSDRRYGYVHACVSYPLTDLEIAT
ncbi:MAG: 2Fe-2S iron-sulfur cluster binding domain-containing protein [Proteobacteria bacterium]|nr:2Fe-2S iron-sulfur cluster binding domain-containing protein [Pseudomonadota bacterium]MBU1742713.1 2Fe-2S iron-sulfur cluster binding domain-containing protein [Pseudomonadota bacterium]